MNNYIGPLKVWQWGLIIGGVVIGYYLWRRYQNNQANAQAQQGMSPAQVPTDPTTGLPYGLTYSDTSGSAVTQLSQAFIDPTTGQPYFQEMNQAVTTLASQQTTDTQAIEDQFTTLTSTLTDMLHTTATVPTPTNNTTTNNTTTTTNYYPNNPPGGGGGGGSGGGIIPGGSGGTNATQPQPTNPPVTTITGASSPLGLISISYLPIAQQIQMFKGGQVQFSQLGPHAQTIYKAGGISTQFPTAASIK
jgi:hypothetical protein